MESELGVKQRGMDRLPFDMIVQVLLRLEVKAVARFGCTSKQWYGLASSLSFQNLYAMHQHSQKPSRKKLLLWSHHFNSSKRYLELKVVDLTNKNKDIIKKKKNIWKKIFFWPKEKGVYLRIKLDKDPKYIHDPKFNFYYASSCHGLVCFVHRFTTKAYVVNPSTKDVLRLPEPYHPCKTLLLQKQISIGFLPTSNQFKIVSLYQMLRSPTVEDLEYDRYWGFEILTLTAGGTNSSWTRGVKYLDFKHLFMIHSVSICIKGVIYWLITLRMSRSAVLAFDLEKEEAKIILAPDDMIPYKRYSIYKIPRNVISLIELCGSLCIVQRDCFPEVTRIWMLTKEAESATESSEAASLDRGWVKLFGDILKTGVNSDNSDFKNEVVFLNIESLRYQYLHNVDNKKTVLRYGDNVKDNDPCKLVLLPNIYTSEECLAILFSENLFSLQNQLLTAEETKRAQVPQVPKCRLTDVFRACSL